MDFMIGHYSSKQLLSYVRHSFLVSGKKLYGKPVKPIFFPNTDFSQKLSAFHRTLKKMFFMNSLALKTYKNLFLDNQNIIFSVFSVM